MTEQNKRKDKKNNEEVVEKRHLSQSQLSMYMSCPLSYKYRYIDGLKIPPRSYLTIGSTFHATLEKNYSQKIESHKDLKASDMTEIFSSEFNSRKDDTEWKEGEDSGKMKDHGVKIIETYHEKVSPIVQPTMVEKKYSIEFEDIPIFDENGHIVDKKPFPFTFMSIIDLVDDNETIVDHKFQKMRKRPSEILTDMQLTAYAMAYRQITGKREKALRFDVIIKNQAPCIESYITHRTDADIAGLLKIMSIVYGLIDDEVFYPNPKNTFCSENTCGYWNICRKEWWKNGSACISKVKELVNDDKKFVRNYIDLA